MRKTDLICGIAAAALVVVGIVMAVRVYLGYQKGREGYDDMESAFTSTADGLQDGNEEPDGSSNPENENTETDMDADAGENVSDSASNDLPEDAPERITVDWDSLTESYEDCVAWIQIPAVEISYPVMQSEDNDYYLHRAPDGSYLYAGSIFMDYQNDADMEDYNTVIYGHNMRDGSMFAKLKLFRDSEVIVLCPYFWIYTPDGDFLYRIFSVHSVNAVGDAYTISFEDYGTYAEWFDEMAGESETDSEISSSDIGRVVTLSTCNGNNATRLVVQGVLVWAEYGGQ
ncbi:MAG: class B sortase [Lachnospiraceae bacterium]|nr:class B sortase [Lachnospiraceae bacterium]